MIMRLMAIGVAGLAAAAHGQVVTQTVQMTGAAELPTPVNTVATGTAEFSLDLATNLFTWHVMYEGLENGLGGVARGAHIHIWTDPATRVGGISIDFGNFGSIASMFSGQTTLTAAQRTAFEEGRAYINIHSNLHPRGEIRGDIRPLPAPGALSLAGFAALAAGRRRR